MLDWMKTGRSDHPLADDKSAREAIADLPTDTFKALEELARWLDELNREEALKVPRLFEIVDRIDQAARGHLRKLQVDYISGGGRLQRFHENRLRTTATGFWKRLADGYALVLRRFQSGASGSAGVKDNIPLVVARGMRALSMLFKWQLLHYRPVPSDVWPGLGQFLAYAEGKGFAGSTLTVYTGSESTIQREFLKSAMLAVSSTDSLPPQKLDIAERLIAHLGVRYVMQRQPAMGCQFYADLSGAAMPARFVERVEIGPGIRFFGPGDAAKALSDIAASIQVSGAVPADLDLGGPQDATTVAEVMRHLERYWGGQPPARTGERRRSIEQIDVVHGYDEILARLREDKSQDLDFEDSAETWSVENESEGGYGAILPQSQGDWVKIGTLLGVKLSDGAAWGVGIVRRISARDGGQRYVGVQLLARGATVVEVKTVGGSGEVQHAILLPSSMAESLSLAEMRLMLREGSFSPKTRLEMNVFERSYLLVPSALTEGGQDYDMARYRVQQRDAS